MEMFRPFSNASGQCASYKWNIESIISAAEIHNVCMKSYFLEIWNIDYEYKFHNYVNYIDFLFVF